MNHTNTETQRNFMNKILTNPAIIESLRDLSIVLWILTTLFH